MDLSILSTGDMVAVRTSKGDVPATVLRVIAVDGRLGGLVEVKPLRGRHSRRGTFVPGRDLRPAQEV